jgi:hypothetical protein
VLRSERKGTEAAGPFLCRLWRGIVLWTSLIVVDARVRARRGLCGRLINNGQDFFNSSPAIPATALERARLRLPGTWAIAVLKLHHQRCQSSQQCRIPRTNIRLGHPGIHRSGRSGAATTAYPCHPPPLEMHLRERAKNGDGGTKQDGVPAARSEGRVSMQRKRLRDS